MFFDSALDLLFPPFCVACSASGDWWCARCRDLAARPMIRRDVEGIDELVACGFYHEPRLRTAIHALKYQGATAMKPALESFVRRCVASCRFESSDAVVLIPAAPSRVRERGFDQAELLTKIVCSVIPAQAGIQSNLLKRRETHGFAQAKLAQKELRAANVHGALRVAPNAVVPETILLVDDVVTTGATIKEAAAILRDAGAKKIYGFALAVGE